MKNNVFNASVDFMKHMEKMVLKVTIGQLKWGHYQPFHLVERFVICIIIILVSKLLQPITQRYEDVELFSDKLIRLLVFTRLKHDDFE